MRASSAISARDAVGRLPGIGPKRAAALTAEEIATVEDLLWTLPFRWEDRRAFSRVAELEPDAPEATLDLRVVRSRLIRTRRRGLTLFRAVLRDASGEIEALWWNQPYLARVLTEGRRLVAYGAATAPRTGSGLVLENPDYEILDDAEDARASIHTGRIVPVYRRAAGLGSRALRALMRRTFDLLDGDSLPEILPPALADGLPGTSRAAVLEAVHFPPEGAPFERVSDRRTPEVRALALEEMFVLQVALAGRRRTSAGVRPRPPIRVDREALARLEGSLPFRLTAAQRRVLDEIASDLGSERPMARLLQGDVGSGKTVVALLALVTATGGGRQGALMAPTEVLAEQHHRTITARLREAGLDLEATLLTGSLRGAERDRRLRALARGDARIAVGTHALFDGSVAFRDLALVVIDEQHRFGVAQRLALARKGAVPDVLVMTATPIPRTLAMTLYGDLDVSAIDEAPPGRPAIRTVVRAEEDRERVLEGLRRELEAGRQAFVVVPRVEEDDRAELRAVEAHAAELRRGLRGRRVGVLHGRMRPRDKDAAMTGFASGSIDVLVATTVVEVGIDVPNATVMIVEHAERFGLAQLHQLRGRVGRGSARSYCVLMVGSERAGRTARDRLSTLERSADGFEIAERDLALRGPGAVLGTRQHGLADARLLAVALREPGLVEAARSAACALDAAGIARVLRDVREGWRRRLALGRAG